MATVRYVSADDWCGVYVDDDCIHQGHDVPRRVWFELLGQGPFEVDESHAESELAYDVADADGQFPKSYAAFLAWTASPVEPPWPDTSPDALDERRRRSLERGEVE